MRTLGTIVVTTSIVVSYVSLPTRGALADGPQANAKTSGCCLPVSTVQTTTASKTVTAAEKSGYDFFCPSFPMMQWGSYTTWVGTTGSNSDDTLDCFTMMVDIAGDPTVGGNCSGDGSDCVSLAALKMARETSSTGAKKAPVFVGLTGYEGDKKAYESNPETTAVGHGWDGKVARTFIPGKSKVIQFKFRDENDDPQTVIAQIFVANLYARGVVNEDPPPQKKKVRIVAGRGTQILDDTPTNVIDETYELNSPGRPVEAPGYPHLFYYEVNITPTNTINVPIITHELTPNHGE